MGPASHLGVSSIYTRDLKGGAGYDGSLHLSAPRGIQGVGYGACLGVGQVNDEMMANVWETSAEVLLLRFPALL